MKKELSIAFSLLVASTLLAQTYEVDKGWSLLGTEEPLATMDILNNKSIENIVIFSNGTYKYSANNDFSVIPAKNGFWVYANQSTILDTTPKEFRKLDGDTLLEVDEDATSWDILEINDLNLRVEMKSSQEHGETLYTVEDGAAYCKNLTVGLISGWKLPTQVEFDSLTEIYVEKIDQFLLYDDDGEHRYMVDDTKALNPNKLTNEYDGYNLLTVGRVEGEGWLDGLRVICVKPN